MNQIPPSISRVQIIPYELRFRNPARTSRSVLHTRPVYYILATGSESTVDAVGWGEVAPLDGLSPEGPDFYQRIDGLLHNSLPVVSVESLLQFPSFRFAIEAASLDLEGGGRRVWLDGSFARGDSSIAINGLIWMGDKNYMLQQIRQKLEDGYHCLKLKIGGIDFDDELELLKYIRQEFSPDQLELRLDANGSFEPGEAPERLARLSEFSIHSIEQPIKAGQYESMARLCESNIIPIALDEELIGIKTKTEKENIVRTIRPQHLIFKPSLIGGLSETMEYITLCDRLDVGWWVTSALESNVGLNILAQFCDRLNVQRAQGLGTGKLFTNNIDSPLQESKGMVFTDPSKHWGNIKNKR